MPEGAGFQRAKLEPTKKPKGKMIQEANEKMIRAVKFADESFFAYDHELTLDDNEEDEIWQNKDELQFSGAPGALWSDRPTNKPLLEPEAWTDRFADEVEVNRLSCSKISVTSKERLRAS